VDGGESTCSREGVLKLCTCKVVSEQAENRVHINGGSAVTTCK
jgi:hypothetical protein